MTPQSAHPSSPVALGVIIRFKNSASTLPGVLAALQAQTLQADLILGIDTGSTDGSPAMLTQAGATVVPWSAPYHHAKVLNFGLSHCMAERVLILSSHTVLESPDALERLNAALDDPLTACASGKWDDDPFYGDAVTWSSLSRDGLKLGSIYSNSFGLLRRKLWEELPFDESLPTMEDYAWALEQVRRGYTCRRVEFRFRYQRQANPRDFIFTATAFRLASRFGLRVRWLGRIQTLRELCRLAFSSRSRASDAIQAEGRFHRSRLMGSLFWRFSRAVTD